MGIFNRRKNNEVHESAPSAAEHPVHTEGDTGVSDDTQLQTGSGLHTLVELMRASASGHLTLELKQSGNDMSLSFFANGSEKESTVVVPGDRWFSGVAELYTDEEKGPRGPWSRALIVIEDSTVSGPQVQVSYLNTATQTTNNLTYTAAESAPVEKNRAGESLPEPGNTYDLEPRENVDKDEAASPLGNRFDRIGARLNRPESSTEDTKTEQTFADIAFARTESTAAVSAEEAAAAIEDREEELAEHTDVDDREGSAGAVDSTAAGSTRETVTAEPQLAEVEEIEMNAFSVPEPVRSPDAIPQHLDDDFDTVPEPEESTVGTAAAGSATAELDAPESALAYDVSPSYRQPEESFAKPSTTAKAEGNLVLTEAEVVSRLSAAQEALFGADGSARDVSTVLIRIRALGSYYDALTHVRTGGFWDQRKTFELVPEEVLNVLELKADSYLEGQGSPLAISFRFTPGIPPVAQFDYSNEEAFVKYSDHLPAQQYMEELRMFPRTGANIPEHINRALTSWTF